MFNIILFNEVLHSILPLLLVTDQYVSILLSLMYCTPCEIFLRARATKYKLLPKSTPQYRIFIVNFLMCIPVFDDLGLRVSLTERSGPFLKYERLKRVKNITTEKSVEIQAELRSPLSSDCVRGELSSLLKPDKNREGSNVESDIGDPMSVK